jgi:serine/threonine protein kinase
MTITSQNAGYAGRKLGAATALRRVCWSLKFRRPAIGVTGDPLGRKQKLVHRDIKPSNVMVSVEEGSIVTAKIIDLGLAKPAPDAPAEAAISIPGAFAGTPEFASPEQFAGIGVDIRSELAGFATAIVSSAGNR